MPAFLAFFASLGTWFQPSTTLFEKKFLLTSNLACLCLRLRGPSELLVALSAWAAIWNQVSLFTLSIPLTILNVCSMSAWCRLSSSVVRPNSFSLSSYTVPFRPETMATALLCIFSKTALSLSDHGDHAGEANSRCGLTYCMQGCE